MGGMNEIRTYCTRHVVTCHVKSIKCVASLPFMNPLPWPHNLFRISAEVGHPATFRLMFF